MISYSVPNHVTPVFYYIISINNFYFSLLYRQVRISHPPHVQPHVPHGSPTRQETVLCAHRLLQIHFSRLSHMRPLPSTRSSLHSARRQTHLQHIFLFQGILLRSEPDLHQVSSRNPALLTLPCVRSFHPFCSLILR